MLFVAVLWPRTIWMTVWLLPLGCENEKVAAVKMMKSDLNILITSSWRFSSLHLAASQPDKIRDAQRRRPSDPDYDPRTLFVPEGFLSKQSPGLYQLSMICSGHRQWWKIKSELFDTVLFFKVGKFYEVEMGALLIFLSGLSYGCNPLRIML